MAPLRSAGAIALEANEMGAGFPPSQTPRRRETGSHLIDGDHPGGPV